MWHEYLAFLISFMVIGTFWMVVAFMPFPSSIISRFAGRTATIFYALVMMLAGLLFSATWHYAAHHNRLTDPDLGADQRRRQLIAPLVTTTVFLLSIGIAFWNPDLARLSWILLVPASMFVNQKQTP